MADTDEQAESDNSQYEETSVVCLESSTTGMPPKRMISQVIDTKRDKPAILYAGYRFSRKCVNKNQTMRWICTNRSCPGALLTTEGYEVLLEKSHTCVPNEAKNDVDLCLHKAKKRAREELLPIPEIYRQELMQVQDDVLDPVVVPTFASVKDRFYRQRQKSLEVKALPKKREEIVISEPMQHLLLTDDDQEDRLLDQTADTEEQAESDKSQYEETSVVRLQSTTTGMPPKRMRREEQLQQSFVEDALDVIMTPGTPEEVQAFGNYVVSKMKGYTEQTRKGVEHAIFDILIKADRGYYENSIPPTSLTSLDVHHASHAASPQ